MPIDLYSLSLYRCSANSHTHTLTHAKVRVRCTFMNEQRMRTHARLDVCTGRVRGVRGRTYAPLCVRVCVCDSVCERMCALVAGGDCARETARVCVCVCL